MNPSFNEKFVAYAALISGLCISAVAIYFSVVGLAAIFAAATIPIVIMGLVLELSKLVASSWLKLNWRIASFGIKCYLLMAVAVLMLITSIGSFGFLSRAHLDQNSPVAETALKLDYYNDRIRAAKESIEVNRQTLKQMDDAITQVLTRSSDQRGAEKSISIRKSQAKERAQLLWEIQTNQKLIEQLTVESAPLRSSLQKVDLEVGPIKYLAKFVYGDDNSEILEKAVTWIIIALIIVFDPLAVVLLLAAQTSFINFKNLPKVEPESLPDPEIVSEEIPEVNNTVQSEELMVEDQLEVEVSSPDESILSKHPYLKTPFVHFKDLQPIVANFKQTTINDTESDDPVDRPGDYLASTKDFLLRYVQNEEQNESGLWTSVSTNTNITQQEYIKGSQEKGQ